MPSDAILESSEAHRSHMNQLLESEAKAAAFREVVYMLVQSALGRT